MAVKQKIGLMAHYGEDYVAYREKFLAYLENRGHQCFGVVPDDQHRDRVAQSRFPVHFYKYRRDARFVFFLPAVFRQLVGILRSEAPQVLFTYKFFPNFVGIPAARKAGVPIVAATLAGIGFLENRDRNPLIALVFRLYMNILEKADFVISQNREDLAMLQGELKGPQLLLTNGSGVDPERFTDLFDTRARFCEENALPPDGRYLVLCSRLVREKGLFELLSAWRNLEAAGNWPFRLILAGWYDDKDLEAAVQTEVSQLDQVHLLGYQKDVRPLLQLAELVLLPSYYPEGVPRSLTEALAMGKPVITTDHKGCRETCRSGENGYLVPVRDAKALEEALRRYAQLGASERRAMADASLRLFHQKFSQPVVFETLVKALEL